MKFSAFLCLLLPTSLAAQPVELYQRSAPSVDLLYNRTTGDFAGPPGDWQAYVDALQGNWSASELDPVAIIDSGVITDHPLIAPVLRTALDLTGDGVEDEVGHGTFVALQFLGTSGPTPLISIKVFGGDDEIASNGAELITQALQLAADNGARIVNVSAGVDLACANSRDPDAPVWLTPCEKTRMCEKVRDLAGDLIVIAAVGNNPQTTGCPACCANALAVGAVNAAGEVANYSGRFPDILAPGSVPFSPIGHSRP